MSELIPSLANKMRTGKEAGEKYVLMLGAGASLSSGVKLTTAIMTELLQKFGGGIEGDGLQARFSQFWKESSTQQRDQYLREYLDKAPSPGYATLAAAIRDGYIDTILTFNFDRLLQKALTALGLRDDEDFKVIVRGDNADEKLVEIMALPQPRIKILKLHGSLTGATFLWSEKEMLQYPAPIANLVASLTARPIILCGYGFADTCVIRAFSPEGGPIYCVNPGGVPANLSGYMAARGSARLVVDGPEGYFDNFFASLSKSLEGPEEHPPTPRRNPFKYLASHDIADAASFLGRDAVAEDLTQKVQQKTRPVICLAGPSKSGKTSLVRAGMIARLDEERDLPVYLRCRGSLEQSLRQLSRFLPSKVAGESGLSMLQRLTASTTQHVVVVLDQFERVLMQQTPLEIGSECVRCFGELAQVNCPNLTVVCLATLTGDLSLALMPIPSQMADQVAFVYLYDMARDQVGEIIRRLAGGAGFEIAAPIVAEIQDEYARGLRSEQRFSLAHVQTICHLLSERGASDMELYRRLIREERPTLDLAINRCDIVNFIEDVPNVEERCLLRDLIRLVSHQECNQKIVNYVRDHVSGMWAPAATAAAHSGQP